VSELGEAGCGLARMDKTTLVLIGVLFLLTAGSFVWWCFLLWQPERWGAFVDWEYGFWVRRGLLSPALAEKCKRLEKGKALKYLVGGTAVLGALYLVIIGLRLSRAGGL
jgi:hypothetical protein